jgi:cobalt/nickel transport protein
MTRFQKKLCLGLAIMALLSPLGVFLPGMLGSGGAWGEWGPEALQKLVGYLPEGLRKTTGLWNAPVADYAFGGEGAAWQTVSYIISGALGIALVALVIYVVARFLIKNEK